MDVFLDLVTHESFMSLNQDNVPTPDKNQKSIRDEAVRYFQGRTAPFTQKELEEFLQVTRFTLLKYRKDGVLRAFVRGSVLRYHLEDVYRLLMSQTA